ncbi:MAG: MATE family efflux transporter [Erysipelotrichia bacterium]|nr:MATE family efflux transporter [Erysipelotrichia bacterium]
MKISNAFIKKYFKYGWPIILSQLIIIVANNLSVALMGDLSANAINGYTLANEAFTIFSMIALGLTGGFHVFISQYYGVQNRTKYNQVLRYGMKFCSIISIVFAGGFFIFAQEFIKIFATDEVIIQYGKDYLQILCWTFIPYMLNLLWSETYSFTGQTKVTMVSGTANSVLTIILCYIFLQKMNMGIMGAALSIFIGRLTESVFLIYMLNREGSEFKFSGIYPSLSKEEKIQIISSSFPLILNEGVFSVATLFIMKNYSYVSETRLACLTVINNISQLFFIGNKGAGPCIGVMVGGELGKGYFDEAKDNAKKTYWMAVSCCAFGAIFMFICSPYIPKMFHLEGELADLCHKMILVKCITGVLGGNTMVFYNILRVGSATKEVFYQDGLFTACCPLVTSYLCSRVFNVDFLTMYIVQDSMQIVKTLVGYYFYRKGHWIKKIA